MIDSITLPLKIEGFTIDVELTGLGGQFQFFQI